MKRISIPIPIHSDLMLKLSLKHSRYDLRHHFFTFFLFGYPSFCLFVSMIFLYVKHIAKRWMNRKNVFICSIFFIPYFKFDICDSFITFLNSFVHSFEWMNVMFVIDFNISMMMMIMLIQICCRHHNNHHQYHHSTRLRCYHFLPSMIICFCSGVWQSNKHWKP